MRSLIFLLSFFLLVSCQNKTAAEPVPKKPILFTKGTLEEAIIESKQLKKPILLAFHASWCKPCKQMDAEVYSDREVGAFFNREFINYKIDSKAPGAKSSIRQFAVRDYPTLVFADSNGENLISSIGLLGTKQLLAFGEEALVDFKKKE